MAWNPFRTDHSPEDILQQAEKALVGFQDEYDQLAAEKDQKMKRQVELWSVLTPSEGLESEYKGVSAHISFVIKKMLCLEQHIKQLKLARYHAQNGDNERLRQVLAIANPCSNVESSITEIQYQV